MLVFPSRSFCLSSSLAFSSIFLPLSKVRVETPAFLATTSVALALTSGSASSGAIPNCRFLPFLPPFACRFFASAFSISSSGTANSTSWKLFKWRRLRLASMTNFFSSSLSSNLRTSKSGSMPSSVQARSLWCPSKSS
jgi:hypothetical protein